MPSPKATLDLDAWSNFLPPERTNDYEYNLLLYKFRSFYNEVKSYHELHSDCSVTKAVLTHSDSALGLPTNNTSSFTSPISRSLKSESSGRDKHIPASQNNSNGKQGVDAGSTKPYLEHQNSVPLTGPYFGRNDQQKLQSSRQIHQDTTIGQQLNNSSYNLPSLGNTAGLGRPEIKQRGQTSNLRLLLSKSSERLDSSNNNYLPLAASLKNQDAETRELGSPPIVRDDKYLQNDANIYDAVSPDDNPVENTSTSSLAFPGSNVKRLSLPHTGRLDAAKSALGLGVAADAKKGSPAARKTVMGNRSTPNWNNPNDRETSNSFSSSNFLDRNHQSNSSLSLLADSSNMKDQVESHHYANYVNIDFFLKRSSSPSFDGLEEDATNDDTSDDSDEDTTQMSHSLSSDLVCDENLTELSPREIARKLSTRGNNTSSTSITPASSGDLLDEHRGQSTTSHTSPRSLRQSEVASKLSAILSSPPRDNDASSFCRSSTSPRDSNTSKNSPMHQTLGPIHEHQTSFLTTKHSLSLDQDDKDGNALAEAHHTMRSFLSDLNLSSGDDVFEDKAQRRIVKESFAVEYCGRRKLRHLFLFNDVIVCAKYQASSKQKFTFDVRWYLNLNGVTLLDVNDAGSQIKYDKESIDNQILAIRTNLMLLRGQLQHIKRSKHKQPSKIIKKLKKKRTELEAELVLLLPHLPLVIKHSNGKKYTFFMSSNFDRNQWIESIKFLQSQLPITTKGSSASPSSSELQAWIQTCRKNLNPSLGTFLLRSNCDDDLLYGDLYVTPNSIESITKPGNYYFCFEVDSYGHFSQKASSAMMRIENSQHNLNEEYIFPLDGAHTLRILLYEDLGPTAKPSVVGKAQIELSSSLFLEKPIEKVVSFNPSCKLKIQISYTSSELLSMRIPHSKLCPAFGMDITQVCKKEKTKVPLLIQLCVNEVERRGMREVGIYRMSGTSTDIQRLKKAFETNPYVAELLLRDIDINSVTGFLKTYLREMPEGLFSNKLYLKFVAAFNIPQSEYLERTKKMLELFHMIPSTNQETIIYLVEHLVKVNKYENYNKMSLTNLATVLGPNILRPPTDSSGSSSSDPFTAVVIGSMSQAGILYFFLNRKYSDLPLTELDPSELAKSTSGK